MLRELLNASPDVWISDIESHFIPELTRTIGQLGDLADRESFARLAEMLRKTRAYWYWSRRGVSIETDRWYAMCRSHSWPGVLEGLFHYVHTQEISEPPKPWNEILWGDKTPVYMVEMRLLAELFPRSRYVHIIRDPRDCVLSAEKTWGDSPMRAAQRWADRTRTCRAEGRRLGSERYHELRYEDLITDVRGTLERVFGFLGVPTPPDAGRMLRVPENYGSAAGETQIVADNRQKWKRLMPPALQRSIEGVTGDQLDDLGYERLFPDVPTRRLSSAQMTAYRLADAWRQINFRRRELGGWSAALKFLLAR